MRRQKSGAHHAPAFSCHLFNHLDFLLCLCYYRSIPCESSVWYFSYALPSSQTRSLTFHSISRRYPNLDNKNNAEKQDERIHVAGIIVIIFVLLAMAALIIGLIPKTRNLAVTDIFWTRSIDVEERHTVSESGWEIPEGAIVQYAKEEVYSYVPTFHHFIIIGNGGKNPILQPVYTPRAVMKIKYYYNVDKWEYDHTATLSDHNQKPRWPELNLKSNQREGEKKSEYFIDASYKGKISTYTLSYEDWQKAHVGNTMRAKVYADHRIEILE